MIVTQGKKAESLSGELLCNRFGLLNYAFQPIVNIHTGVILGFEALLRGYDRAGFSSISDVFDTAYESGQLIELDNILKASAIRKLYSRPEFLSAKLFYNLDNRILFEPDFISKIPSSVKDINIFTSNISFEISEKHEFPSYEKTHAILREYKHQHYRIAIDDFGSGYSGLTLLYHSDPDYIKIDRFFIDRINDDSRKKFFVANVVNLAHMMGISVIAEGIETVGEYYVCREIGCDYVQGYLIQKPETDESKLLTRYPVVDKLVTRQSRLTEGDRNFISREIQCVEAVPVESTTEEILEKFRKKQSISSFPVVNNANEPLGLLRETDLKKYVFSPYGISILQHKSSSEGIESLISKAPVMEISNPIDKFMDLYSLNQDIDSVIITENGRYRGILGSSSILRILSEKKISIAQDQNPLTKLPGNSSINGYLAEVLKQTDKRHIIAYFDLDNFKPFNDVYGFRQGDRIIRLFADILQEHSLISKAFIGHVGGDDFFIGYTGKEHSNSRITDEIERIIERFEYDVIPFYKESDRVNGCLKSKARNGRMACFPLMTVSAAVICLSGRTDELSMETLSEKIAETKLKAKKAKNHMSVLMFGTCGCDEENQATED